MIQNKFYYGIEPLGGIEKDNIGPFTFHFDIRNGDVSATYDKNGKFLFADVIKCGEWYGYDLDEEKDFLEEMDYFCVDLEEKKNEYIKYLEEIIDTCDESRYRYLDHLRNCIEGLRKIDFRKEN